MKTWARADGACAGSSTSCEAMQQECSTDTFDGIAARVTPCGPDGEGDNCPADESTEDCVYGGVCLLPGTAAACWGGGPDGDCGPNRCAEGAAHDVACVAVWYRLLETTTCTGSAGVCHVDEVGVASCVVSPDDEDSRFGVAVETGTPVDRDTLLSGGEGASSAVFVSGSPSYLENSALEGTTLTVVQTEAAGAGDVSGDGLFDRSACPASEVAVTTGLLAGQCILVPSDTYFQWELARDFLGSRRALVMPPVSPLP